MSPGHDANVILGSYVHPVPDVLQIPHNGLCSHGKDLGIGKFRPVVVDHAAKTHVGQHRHQLLGHVTAPENVNRARLYQGFTVILPAHGLHLHSLGGEMRQQLCLQLPRFSRQSQGARKPPARAVKPHGPGRFPGDVQDQPAVLVPVQGLRHFGAEFLHILIPGIDVLDVYHHIPATDHADVRHLVAGQGEPLHAGLPVL